MLRKFLFFSSVIAMLGTTGCGKAEFGGVQKAGPKKDATENTSNLKKGGAALALNLPKMLQQPQHTVQLALTPADRTPPGQKSHSKEKQKNSAPISPTEEIGLSFNTEFPATTQEIHLNDIPVGSYDLKLDVIDSETGETLLSGYGYTTIQEGSLTTATIVLGKSQDQSGNKDDKDSGKTGSVLITVVPAVCSDDLQIFDVTADTDLIPPATYIDQLSVSSGYQSSTSLDVVAIPAATEKEPRLSWSAYCPGTSDSLEVIPADALEVDTINETCPSIAALPVCIKSEGAYKVQDFAMKDGTCEVVPDINTLDIVDNSFCRDLQGSEGLFHPF